MYRWFEVNNFRCFDELMLAGLERVNLIAGVNNVGKTAILEALFLFSGAYNPELTMRINAFRGIESIKIELGKWAETPWDLLFSGFDTSKKIELSGENETSGRRMLRLRVIRQAEELAQISYFIQHPEKQESTFLTTESTQVLELEYEENGKHGKHYMIIDPKGIRITPISPPPPFPAFFQGARVRIPLREEAERFGKLEIRGEQDVLLRVLQLIEPRLKRLAIVVMAGEPILHGDLGAGRLMPLPIMGEGMVRLTSLILHISNAPNGIILVDEIENGLHHSVLPKIWRAIGDVARQFNTQVFATTHSLECIIAAHRAFTESAIYDFRLHRLERIRGTIRAYTYEKNTLEAAIETGLEVR